MEFLSDPYFWFAILVAAALCYPFAKIMQVGMSKPWQEHLDRVNAEAERKHVTRN